MAAVVSLILSPGTNASDITRKLERRLCYCSPQPDRSCTTNHKPARGACQQTHEVNRPFRRSGVLIEKGVVFCLAKAVLDMALVSDRVAACVWALGASMPLVGDRRWVGRRGECAQRKEGEWPAGEWGTSLTLHPSSDTWDLHQHGVGGDANRLRLPDC